MTTCLSPKLKYLLSVIILCQFFFTAKASNSDSLKIQLIKDWERARLSTKAYLDVMPIKEMNFRPTPEVRSYAEQMLHLARTNLNFLKMATGKDELYIGINLEKTEDYKTKDSLERVVISTYDFVIKTLRELDASILEKPSFISPKYSCLRLLNAGFEHQVHHKGQIVIYLRLKNVTPPGEGLF